VFEELLVGILREVERVQRKLNLKQVVELADDVELRMEYNPDVEFGSDPYTFLHHANARLFLKSQDKCIGSIESDVFYQTMRLDVPELSSQVTHRLFVIGDSISAELADFVEFIMRNKLKSIDATFKEGPVLYLAKFVVDEEWRGKGLGTKGLRNLVEWARDAQKRTMTVYVNPPLDEERRENRRFYDYFKSKFNATRPSLDWPYLKLERFEFKRSAETQAYVDFIMGRRTTMPRFPKKPQNT
jgi:GNAT superfamily N-acetyltransferase